MFMTLLKALLPAAQIILCALNCWQFHQSINRGDTNDALYYGFWALLLAITFVGLVGVK